jgi:glycosyltransferase involved in cell wall biosynthesis
MPEVLGDAAVYIDPYNGRDISDALNGLMSSSSLISTLKQRGLERAKDFTWKKTAQETLDVFRSCAAIR